jgi:hypothetical protein
MFQNIMNFRWEIEWKFSRYENERYQLNRDCINLSKWQACLHNMHTTIYLICRNKYLGNSVSKKLSSAILFSGKTNWIFWFLMCIHLVCSTVSNANITGITFSSSNLHRKLKPTSNLWTFIVRLKQKSKVESLQKNLYGRKAIISIQYNYYFQFDESRILMCDDRWSKNKVWCMRELACILKKIYYLIQWPSEKFLAKHTNKQTHRQAYDSFTSYTQKRRVSVRLTNLFNFCFIVMKMFFHLAD